MFKILRMLLANRITITCDEVGEAYEKAIAELYQGTTPWFKDEVEADEWAGDIAFDVVCNLLRALGFEIVDEE